MMMMMMANFILAGAGLDLLSSVGQVPRGPPMCDSFSARFHESVHDKGLGCGGSLVSSKCW